MKQRLKLGLFIFKTLPFRVLETLKVLCYHYWNPRFLRSDLLLGFSYFWRSPYRCNLLFAQTTQDPQTYLYGETPLSTLNQICQKVGLTSDQTFFDLGCGTGRVLFWVHSFVRCQGVGIDANPTFISTACWIAQKQQCRLTFIQQDFTEATLQDNAVVYLYGTCLEDVTICKLCALFKRYSQIRIVSISYPLEAFDPEFATVDSFQVRYPWGKTTAYINEKL